MRNGGEKMKEGCRGWGKFEDKANEGDETM